MIHFKKVKRKCGVRGCKNTASHHLSRSREFGNSVIICADCLKEALSAISEGQTAGQAPGQANGTAPGLFFNEATREENNAHSAKGKTKTTKNKMTDAAKTEDDSNAN